MMVNATTVVGNLVNPELAALETPALLLVTD